MADAGAARELAQGKIDALRFAQDLERRGDDGTAQIAVMIGTQSRNPCVCAWLPKNDAAAEA